MTESHRPPAAGRPSKRDVRQARFTEYATARQPWLRRVAFLLCQDWHAADDLVQTTMTKLYVNWHRVDDVSSPDAYARTVLVNTFLAERRLLRSRLTSFTEDVLGPEPAAEPAGDLEGALDLRRALPLLPPKQRSTIVLRFYCDLSVEETAREMGCSQGTVKSQTSRALDALRRLMGIESAQEPATSRDELEGAPVHGLRNLVA